MCDLKCSNDGVKESGREDVWAALRGSVLGDLCLYR